MTVENGKTIAFNRRARYDYQIEEEFEAGIVLTGTEVKSMRLGRVSINEAYAGAKDGEIWLINATIEVYPGAARFNHEPRRPRKILLQRRQINKLMGRLRSKGVTLVPMSVYFNRRGLAKLRLGLASGKKEYEKRQTIKERDWQREKAKVLKNR